MLRQRLLTTMTMFVMVLPFQALHAQDGPYPKLVQALTGAPPEGFAIGRGHSAFNGSIDGSIYKMNVRNGQGAVLVEAEPGFNIETDCYKLGMDLDHRTNYLFVAGCQVGNAYVIDGDTGAEVMQYQLAPEFDTVINDVAVTKDAVYFTDSFLPVLYRLPLGRRGALPEGSDAATTIPLPDAFNNTEPFCCGGSTDRACPGSAYLG